jgi:DNA-binding MarR family transcriptional regulator
LTAQLSAQDVGIQTWVRFLRAHAALTRRLNADLTATHGLTLNDYEVLLHLAQAPERVLRRVDLAERLLLTPSGITRLLEGLEASGLVERARCAADGRVVYARLTDAGLERLRESSRTHLAGVDELFVGRFGDEELASLHRLLGRLSDADDDGAACAA